MCVGDFFQLPPVANDFYRDPGKHAFEAQTWNLGLTHKIILSTVVRQEDTDLIQAVNELERGVPSDVTNALMMSLGRPLPPGDDPVILYATNLDVQWHNAMTLEQMDGEEHMYKASDSGLQSRLKKISANKCLALKKDAPVILVKNLSQSLVNGSRGKVLKLEDDGPTVQFGEKAVKLQKESFSVYDPDTKTVVAERIQYPIALAFALTVHKSQGMTLHRCVIHCKNFHQPGQMGVAIGRATTIEGLQVLDYHLSASIKHRKEVIDYCDSAGANFSPDLSCCQNVSVDLHDEDYTHGIEQQLLCDYSDDSEFGGDELDEINKLLEQQLEDPTQEHAGPFDDNGSRELLDGLMNKYTITDTQKLMNKCLMDLNKFNTEKAKNFLNEQYSTLASFVPEQPVDTPDIPSQKNWTNFYSKFQSHLSSDRYLTSCNKLFSPGNRNDHVCGAIMSALRKELVTASESGKKRLTNVGVTGTTQNPIHPSAFSKIRYVGGRTVAKLNYKNMNLVRNVIQSGRVAKVRIENKIKADMLQSITVPQSVILERSKYPESLSDTFRKQNQSCGLTNITDPAFEFFRDLESRRIPLYTDFQEYGQEIFKHVEDSVTKNTDLFTQFASLISQSGYITSSEKFGPDPGVPATASSDMCEPDVDVHITINSLTKSVDCLEALYEDVVHSYLSVTDNEFRRNMLSELGHKKQMEHRKKVLTKQSKVQARTSTVSMESIEKDNSAGKELSHLKLKSLVLEKESSLMSFTRKDLISIGKLYGLQLSEKKNIMITQLATKIKASNSMATTGPDISQAEPDTMVAVDKETPGEGQEEEIVGPIAGPSTEAESTRTGGTEQGKELKKAGKKGGKKRKSTGKGKGKGKKRKEVCKTVFEEVDQDFCAACDKMFYEEDEVPWIGCSTCESWWHRYCCGLDDDEKWGHFSSEGVVWSCPVCNKE